MRGVVSGESPSAWPDRGAQGPGGGRAHLRDHHPRRRRASSTSTPTRARRSTAACRPRRPAPTPPCRPPTGQVVTFGGQPVTTYFFSTSGGETEDVENSFVGSQPKPWLKAVDDPFDTVSPKHRWGPFRFTAAQVQRKLHRYLQGRFKRIKVAAARRLAARRARAGGRHARRDQRHRAAAALGLRALRHVGLLHLGDLEGEQAEAQEASAAGHAGRPDGRRVAGGPRGRGARVAPGGHHRPGADGPLAARRAPPGHALGHRDRRAGPAGRSLLGRRAGPGGVPRGLRAGRGAVRAGVASRPCRAAPAARPRTPASPRPRARRSG